jgi:hypothetical protein
MSDKRVSETGKNVSEDAMSMSALQEAATWADELMEAETQSRREKEYVVRDRLAGKIGVSASYLFRLQYKLSEMSDVRGSVYRALMRGRRAYGLAEQAASNFYEQEKALAHARNSKVLGWSAALAGEETERSVK